MGGKKIAVFIAIVCLSLITGCWDYREVNEVAIVVGCAIDKNEKGDYVLTVEIINPQPKGTESELKPIVVAMEGKSIFDANRNLITRVGQPLFWSHTKVVIIGDKLAHEGILAILDWLYRDREVRPDIWLLVAKDKKGSEIFEGEAETSQAISFQIDQTLLAQEQIGDFSRMELWNFIERLSAAGYSPVVPAITLAKVQDKKIPQVYGTGVFKNDKLKGWLDGYESKLLQWIYSDSAAGALFHSEKGNKSDQSITYEVLKNEAQSKAVKEGKEVIIEVNIKLNLSIEELDKIEPKYYDEQGTNQLERDVELMLTSQIQDLIYKIQHKYDADIFGFGSLIHRTMPKVWHKYDKDWDKYFKDLKIRTNVNVQILESTMMYKTIKVRD